ncbi:MAG: Fis family transcriptional regulator, partial [Ghiorsea sp.]|nr:Fis family transcriptional regulator [Ghiorsea sp.]
KTCKELGRHQLKITKQQVLVLKSHAWPGNIRELKNVIERAVILSKGRSLRLDLALQSSMQTTLSASRVVEEQEGLLTQADLRDVERNNMLKALDLSNWKISGSSGAAVLLGLKPSTLAYRMNTLKIVRKREE